MMREPLNQAERQSRAALDGRVAFASAAICMAAGLIILLDRIGLPEQGAKWLAILTLVGVLALTGTLLRASRISSFYVAGRAIPASWSGLALAGVMAGMGLVFSPPLPGGVSGAALAIGAIAGLAGLLLLTGPLIRKSGAFSAADLLSARFPSLPVRIAMVALVAAICALAALAGLMEAVRLLGAQMKLSPALSAGVTGIVLVLALVPGGLRGLTWSAAAAGGVLLASLAAPILLLTTQDVALPAPVIGSAEAWSHAAERISDWGGLGAGGPAWLALPIALGIAAFAPLLLLPATARDRAGAQFAIGAGAIWMLLIVLAFVMTLALGAIGLDVALMGQRPDRLADIFYRASADGLVSICGQNASGPAQARAACAGAPGFAGVLRAGDVSATMSFLTFGLADTQALGGAWRALTLAGWYGACIALAAAGLHGLATAIGHDLLYRLRDRASITSRRLATTRLTLVGALVLLSYAAVRFSVEPRLLLAGSLLLCAAALAPLLLLTFWPRAGSFEALLALITGLGVAASMGDAMLARGAPLAECMGLAALAGAAAAVSAGVIVSLRPGAARVHGAEFRSRVLRAGAEALTPDRGA
jgi:cation/acetate symporter